MPNRVIKESITTSCEIDGLTAEEERFFYRLIVVCDDFGRMDARPRILRAKCFPLKVDDIKDGDVKKWLDGLVKRRLVSTYRAEGKPYLQMVTFEKHNTRRAQHSKYPDPQADESSCTQVHADVSETRDTRHEKRDTGGEPKEPQKVKYADLVKMEPKEYQKLIDKYGEPATLRMIEILDNYKGAKGRTYKNDYKAILTWVVDRYQEEQAKANKLPPNKPIEKWTRAERGAAGI